MPVSRNFGCQTKMKSRLGPNCKLYEIFCRFRRCYARPSYDQEKKNQFFLYFLLFGGPILCLFQASEIGRLNPRLSVCYRFSNASPHLISHRKGTVSRDFLLLVFFINQFPPASEHPIWTVSNFFENSWRYSQLKVDHRCR